MFIEREPGRELAAHKPRNTRIVGYDSTGGVYKVLVEGWSREWLQQDSTKAAAQAYLDGEGVTGVTLDTYEDLHINVLTTDSAITTTKQDTGKQPVTMSQGYWIVG